MNYIENLQWRYATKKYDATKKVSDEDINAIKEAIQLAASSYGLQPYEVIEVNNPEVREQLKPVSWGQTQITDASHLFVFCNYPTVEDEHIDAFMKLKAETTGVDVESLQGYGDFMKMKLKEKSAEEISSWTAKQAYIALGNALSATAELKIDSTPIEGFEAADYNQILGLNEQGLNACVVLAVGYRHDEDSYQAVKKVRKPLNELFKSV